MYDIYQLIEGKQYNDAAEQLLDAMAFACTNVITFRQLLVRYDAFCRTYNGMPLIEWHLQRSVLDANHPVHKLFSLEGVAGLEKKIVMGLQQQQRHSVQRGNVTNDEEIENKELSIEAFTTQTQCFLYLMNKTDTSLEKAVGGHVVFKDRFLTSITRMKQYMLFGLGYREFKFICFYMT